MGACYSSASALSRGWSNWSRTRTKSSRAMRRQRSSTCSPLPQLAQGAGGGSALAPETIEATKMLERKRKSEAFAKNRAFRVMGTAVRAMSEEMRKKISTNAAKRQLGMRVEPIIPREKGTGRRLTPEEIEKEEGRGRADRRGGGDDGPMRREE